MIVLMQNVYSGTRPMILDSRCFCYNLNCVDLKWIAYCCSLICNLSCFFLEGGISDRCMNVGLFLGGFTENTEYWYL